jgi:pimeloyl-ACP methyl ester carboxylesterase
VLVHGLGLSAHVWAPVLPALAQRHDVVTLDLPGFGSAPVLEGGARPDVAGLTAALVAELDALGLERPAVAGNSLGGRLALELARAGRASRVVAIAPSGFENAAERAFVIGANELLRAQARAAHRVGRASIATAAGRTMLLGGLRARPWALDADAAWADVRALAGAPAFQGTLWLAEGADVAAAVWDVGVPVRIAFGTRDLMLGAVTSPRFATVIPGAGLVPLPGTGHVPMADDPDLVARVILEHTAPA